MMDPISVNKQQLYKYCQDFVAKRLKEGQDAIAAARESAEEETKSAMGDQVEPARDMLQQEIQLNTTMLYATKKLQEILNRIDPEMNNEVIATGSMVRTTQGNYYVAIPAGKAIFDGENWFLISVSSPIGGILLGKKEGESIEFNGKKIKILAVN